ncbi:voltage-dependent calcium channel subunit alpha-2/delta-4-like protein [Lates japonicus]|uniref:Voltage-dependent calcium channel subunit alpha-2/delta-4-like protein n=1 Tax=Lates japonicus TaxID=270547 RepID=A0AAD3RMH7_LATJO|nr:voltage-dependent calcium channel subunit alpha-2/delta-4-like protein [Lates japonicus]
MRQQAWLPRLMMRSVQVNSNNLQSCSRGGHNLLLASITICEAAGSWPPATPISQVTFWPTFTIRPTRPVQQWASVFAVQLRDFTTKYSGSLLLQKARKKRSPCHGKINIGQSRFMEYPRQTPHTPLVGFGRTGRYHQLHRHHRQQTTHFQPTHTVIFHLDLPAHSHDSPMKPTVAISPGAACNVHERRVNVVIFRSNIVVASSGQRTFNSHERPHDFLHEHLSA